MTNTQDNVLIESILAKLENCRAVMEMTETSLHLLKELHTLLQLSEQLLADAPDIFNYRASKHPLPGKQLFTEKTNQHEARLADLGINTSNAPQLYRCPVSLDVIDNPVILNTLYFEYKSLEELDSDPVSRIKITTQDKVISKPVKNIISTFVKYHEIKKHIAANEAERRAYLDALPDSKEKKLLLMSSAEFLQACGIAPEQIPERYFSPIIDCRDDTSERHIYAFPVIIETKHQNTQGAHDCHNKITICFNELIKFQTSFHHRDPEHKSNVLSIEKRRRKNDLRQQKELNLLRSYLVNEGDEIKTDLHAFICEIDHKIKCENQINTLTYEDINPEIPEIINPFTGKPLESIEIDYQLLHELDMFLMSCYFEKLYPQRDKQIELARQLHQHHRPLRINEITDDIEAAKNQVKAAENELAATLQEQALALIKKTAAEYDNKALRGDINYYIHNKENLRYRFPGKSFAEVVREAGTEIPDHLPLGLVPDSRGNAFKYEVMTHPVILDEQFVIDFATLQNYWRARPRQFFGFFGGRADLTGINPFTGNPAKTMRYDKQLKAEIDQFMMAKGFFEKAPELVVQSGSKNSHPFTKSILSKKHLGSLAAVEPGEIKPSMRRRRD